MSRLVLGACLLSAACASGPPRPIDIHVNEDACAHCRMTIVSTRTAAEIVSPGREPVFFDDLACLRKYLELEGVADDAVVFVVDHESGAWIDARHAVITNTSADTPMASGLTARAEDTR